MNGLNVSFRPLDEGTSLSLLECAPPDVSKEELSEILDMLMGVMDCGVEVAVSIISDALLVRICDGGEYFFTSPIGLLDGFDYRRAVTLIADYTVREMIPLRFSDISREEMEVICDAFSSVDASVYPDDDDMFMLEVKNECMRLESIPTVALGRIALEPLSNDVLSDYARLCRDAENNKYWGYNVAVDNVLDTDAYFLDTAEREFREGIAITLGVMADGKLIGEATLYGFNYRSAASIAVRILPEYQRRGYGREAMEALIKLGWDIGLLELYAEVMVDNTPSLAMTARLMEEYDNDGEKVYFKLKI